MTTENIKINFTAEFNYPNWIACIPDLQDENTASFTVSLSDLIDKSFIKIDSFVDSMYDSN